MFAQQESGGLGPLCDVFACFSCAFMDFFPQSTKIEVKSIEKCKLPRDVNVFIRLRVRSVDI